jgi:ethanolamine transporter EutH
MMPSLSGAISDYLAGMLVVLQLVFTTYVWTLSPVSLQSQRIFSLIAAADLLAFAFIIYVPYTRLMNRQVKLLWVFTTGVALVIILGLVIWTIHQPV